MLEKVTTKPSFVDSSPLHKEAIKQGKQFFFDCQKYNVIDKYKSLTVEEVKKKLAETAFPYAVTLENWIGDLNFSSCIRNCNAFNAERIFYVGNRKFDRRAALGTHHYKKVEFIPTIDDFKKLKLQYRIIGIDNIPGAISLKGYRWFKNGRRDLPVMIVMGEESCGLTKDMQYFCEEIVEIPSFGSVRSINAATASGIIMHSIVSELTS